MTSRTVQIEQAGAILRAVVGESDLPSMNEPGAEAFIGDSFLNPAGSVLASGFFELKKGAPLVYTYTYDETKYVARGEFILTGEATGDTLRASEGDVLFFAKGTTA